jgi:hypothetical protein
VIEPSAGMDSGRSPSNCGACERKYQASLVEDWIGGSSAPGL